MNWPAFYLTCFAVGFILSFVSFLSGTLHVHLPFKFSHAGHAGGAHGHAAHGKASRGGWINAASVLAFLAWFGGVGYLLTTRYRFWFLATLGLATLAGIVGASVVSWFFVKVLLKHETALDDADYRLEGIVASVKVQEAEIARVEKELIATVLKQAEIQRQKIETLAAAEKQRLTAEAEGHASAIRTQGEAEAEIIFKKGEAEAKAMNVKAEAYQEYNQAAVIDRLFTSMPEIVKNIVMPLANVDRITVVSTGNAESTGLNKITGDVTNIAAQVPALFEALSGMKMSDLLSGVRMLGDKAARPLIPPAAPAAPAVNK